MPLTIALTLLIFVTGAPRVEALSDRTPEDATIRIRGNENFSPYEFINADGQPDGYNIDIMKAIATKVDLPMDLKLERWSDARRALENGRIEALTGVMYSAARDQLFDFSIPHIAISYALFVHQDTTLTSPQDARGRQIIVVKGVYAHDWLLHNEFSDKIIPVDNPAEALRMLAGGRYDCAVLIRLHGLDLMRQLKITNVKTVGPPVLTQKMGIAVRAGNADLLARLNEGLHLLQRSGEFDNIYRRWFSVYDERALRDRILSAGKIVMLPLVLLLIGGVLWIWMLNRSVERKTAALRSNRQTLAQILEHLPFPTMVANREGQITHWNRECTLLTGIRGADSIGYTPPAAALAVHRSTFLTLLTERCDVADEAPSIRSRMHAADPEKNILDAEVFLPWLGQDGKWLFGTIAPFKDGEGHLVGTIEAWQDLTDRKALEGQLIQAQKMKAMGTLAGSVAHDFASYLQAIGGYTSTAQLETDLDPNVRSNLEGIQNTIAKARNLIRQIMLFSRQDLVASSPVDIRPIIERTLALVKATASENITFASDINSEARIMADETQVGQVLLNLCTNAVQAMATEGGRLTVRVEDVDLRDEQGFNGGERVSGRYLKLTVADTGHGIPPEQMEKIFEPFYTRRRNEGGTGMGLAIVHGIVRGYGGKIEVHGKDGQGAVFEVLWPTVST